MAKAPAPVASSAGLFPSRDASLVRNSGGSRTTLAFVLLLAIVGYDDDGAGGMVNDIGADRAEQEASESPEAPTPDNDQVGPC